MSRIFISYRRGEPDQALAVSLHEHLQHHGHLAFIDHDISIGEDWVQAIERELSEADVFIVLLSERSILSDAVRQEIAYARGRQRKDGRPKILPVRVDYEGPLPMDVSNHVGRIQAVSWSTDLAFELLAARLRKAIGSPSVVVHASGEDITYDGNEVLFATTEGRGAPLPAADPRLVATLETGTIQIDSPFYILRDTDDLAGHCLSQLTPTTIVKSPRQMGKSSLLARMHAKSKSLGWRSWYRDFQHMDADHLKDLDTLFRYLAREMSRVFRVASPKASWDHNEGPMGNLTNYLEDSILSTTNVPVQLIFDEAERIFDFSYRDQFFATIRGWHNRRAVNDYFKNLTIVIGHATTPALWIRDINQSPFNVGYAINLQGFKCAEVDELARRYKMPLRDKETMKLVDVLGGHPYLTRVAIHFLSTRGRTLDQLIDIAADETGPFADHLRGLAWILAKQPELRSTLQGIMGGKGCSNEEHFHRLWAAGLIRGETRADARAGCRLYERYFRNHL